jgi:hypothetical protein
MPSMRLRTFYTIAILFPLVALAAVAALAGGERDLPTGLPPGATVEWLYPTSSVRDLVSYGIVAVWLARAARQRGGQCPGAGTLPAGVRCRPRAVRR